MGAVGANKKAIFYQIPWCRNATSIGKRLESWRFKSPLSAGQRSELRNCGLRNL